MIRERVSKAGEPSFQVLYRHGGRQASRTFETYKAADRFAGLIDALGVERALALLAEEGREKGITVHQLATLWLEHKRPPEVTPRIHAGYRRDYDNWIDPWFGHREAAFVTETDVQDWIDHMRTAVSPATKKPLSAKSIADRHAILHQIFRWGSARSRGLVPHNPCKESELPKRTKTQVKGLRLPELHALLAAGEKVDQDAADLVAFIAGTGWRIGEAVALTAGQVEDDGTAVYVTMTRVLRAQVGFIEGGKSAASVGRRLRVLGPAVGVLRGRMVGLGPGDLVFTFEDGRPGVNARRPWNMASFRDRRWPRIVKAAGLEDRKPTPHWLRHTHVAICHAAGLSLAEIQRRLGHEDIQTTINIYGRMIEDMTNEAAARLDALLTPGALPEVVSGEVVQALPQ